MDILNNYEPQQKDSLTAYTEERIENLCILETRRISYPMLLPHTLEAKYPDLAPRLRKQAGKGMENTLSLLKTNPFDPQEAIRVIEGAPNFFQENDYYHNKEEKKQMIEQQYNEFGIDALELAKQVDNSLIACVNDLDISSEQKGLLTSDLESANIEFGWDVNTSASKESRNVKIDLIFPYYIALKLCRIGKTQMSESLLKSLLATNIAHERGHVLDFSGSMKELRGTIGYSSSYDEVNREYPITFDNNTSKLKYMCYEERWAVYFEHEVLKKMGLSTEIIDDWRRYNLSMYCMKIFDEVPPQRISDFISAVNNYKTENDPKVVTELAKTLEDILSGHTLSQSFPLKKSDIELAINKVSAI
ncbi:hypothetical protein HGA88_05640 [Candidatus Roizmanbacteria bacterium]|nr:hypothetical protein [Candidatus Roizmanbacteria bacterium]